MSDLPADTLTTTIANVIAEHASDMSDERWVGDEWTWGVCCDCGEFVPDTEINNHLAAAVVSVLATHNEHTAAEVKEAAVRSMAHLFRDMAPDMLPRRQVIELLDLRADSYRLAAVSPTPPTHKEQQA